MERMNKKPTFFISSTIYDFRDLRSAIKFFLEEQGCSVLASEFNDFGQPLDVHSYNACISQIEAADYFVLLIGSRTGGWFDKDSKISITHKEYRVAYDLHLKRRIKIITFVRSDVWAVKDDRKELSKFLDGLGLEPTKLASIKSRPSKATADAEVLIDFLEEVGRNKQTDNAVTSGGSLPTANWIHIFTSFRDIVDVLRAQVFAGRPIEQAVGRQLLRSELLEITSALLMKLRDGTALFPFGRIEDFANRYPLRAEQLMQSITIKRSDFERFFFAIFQFSGARIHTQVIDKILSSDVLLDFNPGSGTFRETDVYQALVTMRTEIRAFMLNRAGGNVGTMAAKTLENAGPGNPIKLKVAELVEMLNVADRATNIVLLARASIRCLDGARFTMPNLRPRSPFSDQLEELERENVSMADAERFIAR
jgi:hypothetical protein